ERARNMRAVRVAIQILINYRESAVVISVFTQVGHGFCVERCLEAQQFSEVVEEHREHAMIVLDVRELCTSEIRPIRDDSVDTVSEERAHVFGFFDRPDI